MLGLALAALTSGCISSHIVDVEGVDPFALALPLPRPLPRPLPLPAPRSLVSLSRAEEVQSRVEAAPNSIVLAGQQLASCAAWSASSARASARASGSCAALKALCVQLPRPGLEIQLLPRKHNSSALVLLEPRYLLRRQLLQRLFVVGEGPLADRAV
eukprot:CAMPEP_0173265944 /NCGR_PEP_ID=MMETSP1142-20121109/28882_1 /TAXON_ID=483371 /ORGANISM="non described non described, Strain CCMP2298" /LENGTH=156 /DNA_ID=CAMNT_0014201791 /DNA_START=266 /DNA_END=737 /DNA_ORIENTATION=+